MPDFPSGGTFYPKMGMNVFGPLTTLWDGAVVGNITANSGATWPIANKALFCPFYVEYPVLAQKMGTVVTTQAGNYDLGIYDEKGNKIIANGGAAVPAAGLGALDITDTVLNPGTYFMAMACSSATAAFARANVQLNLQRLAGVHEMATAYPLPTTLTFTTPATNYFPEIIIQCGATL